jgi:hypothetical protein
LPSPPDGEVDATAPPTERQLDSKPKKPPKPPLDVTTTTVRSKEPSPTSPPAPTPPTPGRGGAQHKYLQTLIQKWAEARGWGASIEERILDGHGRVDIALRKGQISVACEIGVSSTPELELQNLQKCCAGGFTYVVEVSTEKKLLASVRRLTEEAFGEEESRTIRFLSPEEMFVFLESIEAETATRETTHRGRKVRVMFRAVEEKDKKARRQTVSRVIAKALGRLGSGQ